MDGQSFGPIVGRSPPMQEIYERLRRFADSHVPVLLVGETGTGKDLFASVLWRESSSRGAFVHCNCAAIPDGLVESELFGHVEGAFTGAVRDHSGLLAAAHGGTLFLDEIAELSREMQAELLTVLESGEYRPVGGERTVQSSFRLISATHDHIDTLIAEHRFREDLFYRLGAVQIRVPPLRDRRGDISLLANHFLGRYRERQGGRGPEGVSRGALDALQVPSWPGNVRQLGNVVEAAAAHAGTGRTVRAEHVWPYLPDGESSIAEKDRPPLLEEAVKRAEREAIFTALRTSGGNRDRAAKYLGISEATLYRKLRRFRDETDD